MTGCDPGFVADKVAESTFNIYTGIVFAAACVVTLLAINNYEVYKRKKRQGTFQAFAYLTMSALFTAFVFGTIGFGVGYIIGYSDRVQDEDVKRQRTQVSSLLVRMFWSLILACGVGFVFTCQRKKAAAQAVQCANQDQAALQFPTPASGFVQN